MNRLKEQFGKYLIAFSIAGFSYFLFVTELVLTNSAYWPINALIILACLLSSLSLLFIILNKEMQFRVSIIFALIVLLCVRLYEVIFFRLPMI
jgi:hypothetical protein